jgi:hypothetical protein
LEYLAPRPRSMLELTYIGAGVFFVSGDEGAVQAP